MTDAARRTKGDSLETCPRCGGAQYDPEIVKEVQRQCRDCGGGGIAGYVTREMSMDAYGTTEAEGMAEPCRTCQGHGWYPEPEPEACSQCGGRGGGGVVRELPTELVVSGIGPDMHRVRWIKVIDGPAWRRSRLEIRAACAMKVELAASVYRPQVGEVTCPFCLLADKDLRLTEAELRERLVKIIEIMQRQFEKHLRDLEELRHVR